MGSKPQVSKAREVSSPCLDAEELRCLVIQSLTAQGFTINGGRVEPPNESGKEDLRRLHALAVSRRLEKAADGLRTKENRLLQRIADGTDVEPDALRPRLVPVEARSEDELLFRYARLHWSIPVSAGYGRRARFLVVDESNDKLIGIIGLGDPIFSLGPRDRWIGWTREARGQRLNAIMDAFVLGAVPPYSHLLGGKLVAALAASNEVRQAVFDKYRSRRSVIAGREHTGQLALLTTMSALGRSSIYNRLRYDGRQLYEPVGFTRGSGEFHFANGLYDALVQFAEQTCLPTAKHPSWGIGFRNKREVVKKVLPKLGISSEWLYHGIERQIFVIPMASNARDYLRGDTDDLDSFDQSADEIFDWFRERWLLPRAARLQIHRDFRASSYALWGVQTT